MKKSTLTFLFLMSVLAGIQAQTVGMPADTTKIYRAIDKMPQYPGGQGALRAFLVSNLHYPVIAEKSGVQGRVVIKFTVGKDGSIRNLSAADCKITDYDKKVFNRLTAGEQERLRKAMCQGICERSRTCRSGNAEMGTSRDGWGKSRRSVQPAGRFQTQIDQTSDRDRCISVLTKDKELENIQLLGDIPCAQRINTP